MPAHTTVAAVPPGGDLLDSLVQLAKGGDAWFNATGEIEVVEEVDELSPEAGDLVDHFAFGLCEVVTSDGERLKIRDAKQPGRVREVSMTMLNVLQPTDSDGKRLFRLARRGA